MLVYVLLDIVECQDWENVADQCARWAADGRCTDLVMATHCARTCNLCQTNEAGTVAQPNSRVSTSQRSTYHHGIITTTTLNDVTSPRQSTQAPVNVVSSTSRLTSVSYVSVGRTSQATVKPMLSVSNVQTTSSRLLSLMISAASQHETALLSRRTAAASDSNVTQSLTDRDPAMSSLRTASHSSIADKMATVRRGDTAAAVSSVTTDGMSYAPVKVVTSTTSVRLTSTNSTQDYLSGTSDAYLRSTVTPATNITNDLMTVTVTSVDDVMSLAAESRDRPMTSSSRDSPAVTSFQSSSDPFVQLVSRLTSTDNDTSSRPHTKPTLPYTTSTSKRNTTFRRYWRSVQLSYFNITSSNSSNNSSSGDGDGEEETVGLPSTSPWRDITHDNATRWSRSAAPSTTPTIASSTQSTLSLYSVTDDATISEGVLNSSLQTTASNQRTVKSHQPNMISFHSTLMPADNSDVTSAESIFSPSSSSAEPMTDRVKSDSASSAANLMDTAHSGVSPSSSDNSFIHVSIPHVTQLSTDNISSQTLLPSTTSDHSSTLNSSTNITSLPVLNDFSLPSTLAGHGVTTASLSGLGTSDGDQRSHTARVSQFTINLFDNYTITDISNVTRHRSTVNSETPLTPVSASTPHPHAASSTDATVSSSTRSHSVWSTTRDTDTRTPGRHHRSTTGTRTHGRLRSHAGLVTRQ